MPSWFSPGAGGAADRVAQGGIGVEEFLQAPVGVIVGGLDGDAQDRVRVERWRGHDKNSSDV
ncbi:hypothetical protein ACFTSF_40965 [Kribbella sp. NPDC056951]|uniref:hypothetical protein n=1 Tax=Kribbella sp. NPDC056951 TaxID=3345978 RepID=UPI003644E863